VRRDVAAPGDGRTPGTLTLLTLLTAFAAHAQTNLWLDGSGKWETPANWSLGLPSANESAFVTNAGTKTVTLDATTVSSAPGSLTISNH
jgi:hypothetical protein